MTKFRMFLAAGTMLGAIGSLGAANAGLVIGNTANALSPREAVAEASGAYPVGISGFTDPATLSTGSFVEDVIFTFKQNGDNVNVNTFFVNGSAIFVTPFPNSSNTFTLHDVPANSLINFKFSSSGGCSITDGGAPAGGACSYLLTVDGSTATNALTTGNSVWIGFSDIEGRNTALAPPLSDNGLAADYQDAVVNVTVPEPASLALVGLGLAGLGAIRRKRV